MLLDRWIYDPSGLQEPEWARKVSELTRWGMLRPECALAAAVIAGEPLPDEPPLPKRYQYLRECLQDGPEGKTGWPEGDLRYDVEAQLFAGRQHVVRKLAEGDRTDAAVALRQMELLQGEMSTPRTTAWVNELKAKIGAAAGYAPFFPHLAGEPEDAPAAGSKGNRLRIQLMSGIRLFLSDGSSAQPKWKRRKSRELFVYLLLQPDYRALRDQVVEQLFGEGDAAKLANHLYVSLHELRSALAGIGFEDAIEVRGGLVGFREGIVEVVDVEQYMTLSRVGDQLWTNDREAAAMLYMDAVRLYGLLGADMPYVDWIERLRVHLLERQTQMLRRLGEYYASLSEDAHTEQWLSAWIEIGRAHV